VDDVHPPPEGHRHRVAIAVLVDVVMLRFAVFIFQLATYVRRYRSCLRRGGAVTVMVIMHVASSWFNFNLFVFLCGRCVGEKSLAMHNPDDLSLWLAARVE
jgi:hypothetical protein